MKRYEIEQKFRISDPSGMRRRLIRLGAKKITGGLQYNEYLDSKGWLRKRKMILRLRRAGEKSVLTLKGKRMAAKYTKRLEYETPVDFGQAKAIFREIGFKAARIYSKRREEYGLLSCTITLDHIPKIGWFLEIEGKEKNIETLSGKLQLKPSDREERSYPDIVFPGKR